MSNDDKKKRLHLPTLSKGGSLKKRVAPAQMTPLNLEKKVAMSRLSAGGKSLQAELAEKEQGLDLVLVGDLTSSMRQYHELLKKKFSSFSAELFQMVKNLRMGIVFYLDHGSGDPYVTRPCGLGKDIDSMQQFIAATQVGWGGDEDEAVEDAFNDVVNMQWREVGGRSVVLFGDVRAHEKENCPYRFDYFDLVKKMYDMGIVVNCVYCGGRGSSDELQKLENVPVGDFSRRVRELGHPNFFSWVANVTGGMIIGVENIDELIDIIMAAAAKDSGDLEKFEKAIKERSPAKLNLVKIAKKADERRRLAYKDSPRIDHKR